MNTNFLSNSLILNQNETRKIHAHSDSDCLEGVLIISKVFPSNKIYIPGDLWAFMQPKIKKKTFFLTQSRDNVFLLFSINTEIEKLICPKKGQKCKLMFVTKKSLKSLIFVKHVSFLVLFLTLLACSFLL